MNIALAITLLTAVRTQLLEDWDNFDYICWALDDVVNDQIEMLDTNVPNERCVALDFNNTAEALTDYIDKQLDVSRLTSLTQGTCSTLEIWLEETLSAAGHESLASQVSHPDTITNCRRAWVDRMIYALQTEGKLP